MGRKSEREIRRKEIVQAFAKVLANHGYAGATISAVALEAGLAPGLLHHHFENKQEMLEELCTTLIQGFRFRFADFNQTGDALENYIDAALKLDETSDSVAAKCWVGIFSEALRDPTLFSRIKRYLEAEIETVSEASGRKLDSKQASAVVAFILGSLVFGAFAPKKAAGFAAPSAKKLARALRV
jgi:TetR/AcrR family transcriptional regulator, transcriptional repressor of bet genes